MEWQEKDSISELPWMMKASRAIAVAGLYELEQLITEIHENNPMLGTIEASGVQNESRKTNESDENKEVTNEKNNNKFAVQYSLNLKFLVSEDLKRLHFGNKRWTKNFSLLFSKINFRKRIRWFFFNSFYQRVRRCWFYFQ